MRFRRATDHEHIFAEHDAVVAALIRHDEAAAALAIERHIIDSLERDSRFPTSQPAPASSAARHDVSGMRR